MKRLLFVTLILSACSDDDPRDTVADAPAGDPGADARLDSSVQPDASPGAPDASASLPDARETAICSGLDEKTCEDTAGCVGGCVSLCDCTCPGPAGYEGCEGCDACPKSCFTFAACVARTPCGDTWCDPATEICVSRSAFVVTHECESVPAGCESDRTCGCAAATLCEDPFNACSDTGPNAIDCACPACL
jgi:hypothetical protein